MTSLRGAALAVAAFLSAFAQAEAAPDARIALVVGNGRYIDSALRNPANDAQAMAAALRERGFDVILRLDTTKQQLEGAIIEFGEKLSEGATGLFYFAGHGMQVQGRNYIIPTDAKLTSEQRIKLEAVDVDAVLDQMQGARSKVNVVILDACRNNPFERRFRSVSGGLAQINAPEGTLIAYATAPGRVAADGEGANGLYTSELLKALRTPGLRVEDVFKQVRINVSRASNGAQTPWEASSLVGDFYFVPPSPASSTSAEIEFWNSINNSEQVGEYKAYLAQFPEGQFALLARARIEAIEKGRSANDGGSDDATRAELEQLRQVAARIGVLNGSYKAKFMMISSGGFTNYDATIHVQGASITGTAMSDGVYDACSFNGTLVPATGDIAILGMSCRYINAYFKGKFALDPKTGQVEGKTLANAVTDHREVQVIWRR